MDIRIKRVRVVKYGRGLKFITQFLPVFSHRVSLGELR